MSSIIRLLETEVLKMHPKKEFNQEDSYLCECSEAFFEEINKELYKMVTYASSVLGYKINPEQRFTKIQLPTIGYIEFSITLKQGYKIEKQ